MGFADLLAKSDRTVRARLGSKITYTPGGGEPVEVDGIFDAAYELVDLGGIGVSSVSPAVFFERSALPSDPDVDRDARVNVDGTEYQVHTVRPSMGGVVLALHRVM